MRYPIKPINRTCAKDYGFLSFAKNIGKNLNNNYRQKTLWYCEKIYNRWKKKKKTVSKTAIQKIAEATGYLIGNEIAVKIINALKELHSKNSVQNALKTVGNELEIRKRRYLSPGKRQQIIEELRLV